MDRSTAVSERILGESLRIAARLGTLRPGVPIAVQADAAHPGDAAPPAEFRRSRVGFRRFDGWKEIA